jgi:hypothetical protein
MNNVYNSISVPGNTPTVVNSVNGPVPPAGTNFNRAAYRFKGLYIWSEIDCDVTVTRNVTVIGGGRINGAVQTLFLDFHSSPYDIMNGDVLTVQVTTSDLVNSHIVRSTILVEQL